MGYTTDFEGQLNFDKPLSAVQVAYINLFCSTRRMKRDVVKLTQMYKGEHGLDGNYGHQGEYFAKDDGQMGQSNDASILDYNDPPGHVQISLSYFSAGFEKNRNAVAEGRAVPGLWCQWEVSEDGTRLYWSGSEKFYKYVEWLHYLINHFFNKWGNKLTGEITWQGEDATDMGKIQVKDSIVTVKRAKIIYE